MNDLISRKEAIDAVEHITSSMSVCVNTDECHGMKRMQRQAVIELANLSSAQPERWIPVSEGLPEEDVQVLVTDDAGGLATIDVDWGYFDKEYGRFEWFHSQNVTAWMPLPEPWREEENERM